MQPSNDQEKKKRPDEVAYSTAILQLLRKGEPFKSKATDIIYAFEHWSSVE